MSVHQQFIGCDVSKAHLDLFDEERGTWTRIPNSAEDIAAFANEVKNRPVLVVLEATGHYDRRLRRALTRAGIAFVRVNPERARSFARALGILAKTDKVDARMLAEMGRRLSLDPDPADCPVRLRLTDLVKRRDQLVATRTQEKTRRHEMQGSDIAENIDKHIMWLTDEIKDIEHQIKTVIASHQALARQARLIQTVPGIGPVTSTVLLALMPELGCTSRRAVAALAGVAPINNDSGIKRGQRHIRAGRRRVRSTLYMAAVSAARSAAPFKRFYEAMIEAGKPPKVALIAIARKILVIVNALVRDQVEYKGSS